MISRKTGILSIFSVLLIIISLVSAVSADSTDFSVTPVVYEKTGNVSSGTGPSFTVTDGDYTLLFYWKMSPSKTTYCVYAADLTVNESGIYENGTPFVAPESFSGKTLRCEDLRLDGIIENLDSIEETALPEGTEQRLSLSAPYSNNNTWFLLGSPEILYVNANTDETNLDCQVTIETLVLGDTETTITVSGEKGTQTKTLKPSDKTLLSGAFDTSTSGSQYEPQKLFYKVTFSGIVAGEYDVTITGKDASGKTVSATEKLQLGAGGYPEYDFLLQYEKDGSDKTARLAGYGENASAALKDALNNAGIEYDITYGTYGPSINMIDGLEMTNASGSWLWWAQYHMEDNAWVMNDKGMDSYPEVYSYALVYGDGTVEPQTLPAYRFLVQYEKDGTDKSAWINGIGENASNALMNALDNAEISYRITYGNYGASIKMIDGLEMTNASGEWLWWSQYHMADGEWIMNDAGFDDYPEVYTYALVYGDGTVEPKTVEEYSFFLQYEKEGIDKTKWIAGTGTNASNALENALTLAKISHSITYGNYGASIKMIDSLEMTNASGEWLWWSQYHMVDGEWVMNAEGFDDYPEVYTYALVYGDGTIEPKVPDEYKFLLQYEKDGADKTKWITGSGENASGALMDALDTAMISYQITYGNYGASIKMIDGLEMTNASGEWLWWNQYHMVDGEWVMNAEGFDDYPEVYTYALVYGDGTVEPKNLFIVTYDPGIVENAWVPENEVASDKYIVSPFRAFSMNHVFTGWNLNGCYVAPGDEIQVSSNIVLTAQWNPLENGFNPDTSDLCALKTIILEDGEYVSKYDLDKDGCLDIMDLVLLAQYIADDD